MTETEFIRQNKDKWKELELLLQQKTKDANSLHRLFVKVSSDLSYARTYFPNRSVRLYLNNLTQDVFNSLGKKKKASILDQLVLFFTHILPLELHRSRRALIISFLVFGVSLFVGVLSSIHNPEFATIILGKDYIEMTDENIANDDPMAVYKDERKLDMFFGITYNNIRVAFLAFVVGLFGSVGTIIILMMNGIMVGAFQYYFYAKGYFLTSFLTIWIHGTIEISAIIIAGAAGIILGNGFLFPRTHSRTSSLQISSRRAIRILLGTVPLFIIAGLLESFVTRLTDLPTVFKVFIIGFSAVFVLFMFVIYPHLRHKQLLHTPAAKIDVEPYYSQLLNFDKFSFKSTDQIFSISSSQFRDYFHINLTYIVLPITGIACIVFWFKLNIDGSETWIDLAATHGLFTYVQGGLFIFLFLSIVFFISVSSVSLYYNEVSTTGNNILQYIRKNMSFILPLCFITTALYFFITGAFGAILSVVFFCQIVIPLIERRLNPLSDTDNSAGSVISESFNNIFSFFLIYVMLFLISQVLLYLLKSPIVEFLSSFVHWHSFFDDGFMSTIYINHIMYFVCFLFLLPLVYFLIANQFNSVQSQLNAYDLKERYKAFGQTT